MNQPCPIHNLEIPKAFASHDRIMQVLYATIEGFSSDEQQVIYYYHFMEISPTTIASIMDLTERHVTFVLGLYTERLACKLELFKRVQPYNAEDMMQVRDILLPWSA